MAVSYALAHNPDSTIAKKRIEEANALGDIAKASDYPSIDLISEYGQTNNAMYSFGNILNQGTFDNSIDFNDPGRTDNLQLKAQMNYTIYNGGRDRARKEAAAAQLKVSQAELVAVHQQLGFEVVKTFQAIIQAEEMVLVRIEALDAISAALDAGKARFEAGDMLKQDILNLELQQSRVSENLIRSRHVLELTKRAFLNLLGLRDGEVNISKEEDAVQALPDTIGYEKRHELQNLAALELAAKAELAEAQGATMPSVDGFASYQADHGWERDGSGNTWLAGIRATYTLFDGRRSTSRITHARLKLQEIVEQRQKIELKLNLEVQQAQLDFEQAGERLAVTTKMVGVAEEVARLSRARFKEGLILSSDLIDFEMRLSDARARHLAAKAGYRVAIANLRRATGLEQFSE